MKFRQPTPLLGRDKSLLEIPINNAAAASSSAQLIGKESPYKAQADGKVELR